MGKKVPPRVRGQIERFLSPYEQTFFGDVWNAQLMMTKMRRKLTFIKDMAPGVLIFASVYTWGNATHAKHSLEHRY